jgi:hypothetical protein
MTRITTTTGALAVLSAVLTLGAPVGVGAAENEFASQLTDLAKGQLREIAENSRLVAAIAAQNAMTGGYDQGRIDALDKQWRAEVGTDSKPLIDETLGNDASKYLAEVQDQSGGLFTEIFATDAKGLNVGQSTITSDYWQGDEEKFTGSYGAGADAIVIGDIEQDESTQRFQSQVSITITDPATGAEIGSITAGVDLSML